MTRRDLVWLIGLPVYVVLGTARHELAHAAVAIAQGATITSFVIVPTVVDGVFLWGYVGWEGGDTTWLATAAPYLLDLLTVLVGLGLAFRVALVRWVWINIVMLFLASPLANSGYQYIRTIVVGGGDVGELLAVLPAPAVHGWFLLAVPLYGVASLVALRRGPRAQTSNEGSR